MFYVSTVMRRNREILRFVDIVGENLKMCRICLIKLNVKMKLLHRENKTISFKCRGFYYVT